ncbi:hypothetical protein [Algoriphagus persicinus]|uniref:hypothetical protein n=1 Tax=Algoriphagus persicinus TaxID=3108754 RepID=UPI002B3C502B|nr:hypothetical protein [Algoriphagus sp. E1-3-M2]MEB2784338.1 hypothetical protein [Algoriphagus sp. E1-3-M2]
MKKSLISSMLIANAIFLFTACQTKQPVDQLLKNDSQRSEIISSFIDHQPYRTEMMNAMMENDSCRLLIGQQMMGRPEMMGMMMSDPTKMRGTMDHMVNMAAQDTVMFNDMIQMMKEKPEMWNKVMRMNTSTIKNN